ncbi:TRAP transporter, 4TM/12TM fusion protein [Desulforapulum autotrophicum HRM2]|uniref:TRAP transporter, 4TM/12TM fusion protein n=1 Tax=Desulforapulum autotrophicum (strain ATCC 43914 / DSM 3382 / VKM B-1955 / HRM2) TaxID=177437 RepID=C0QJW7_DESAH|nr:TRAP transporter fused permease subunit [Desulforapulum autotrophicum]ACN15993.1 TRAP transporter, 4TM/12TM fusion protein [Desulforapulum autotrophicum HRM2]
MKDSNTWQNKAIGAWLAALSIFQLYTATVGIYQPRIQRGIHLLFLLPAAFVIFPASTKKHYKKVGIFNWILAALSILPPLYIIYFYERLTERLEFVDDVLTIELVLGTLMIVLILEAVRRAVVPAMAYLIIGFFVYLYAAPYLPGVFYSKPIAFTEIIEMQYLITDAGIFGSITGVSATFVALFVIFGAFMEVTKTGQFFTDLACRIAGKSNGGPAKIAVISSGLFGSISGVAAANVYSTGVFTIPLMKKLGYRRTFAGAVEAAASTGGMLMPPVMGAGAFVMAEITGISYVNIVIAAMLGSLLLYASMVVRVHYMAQRLNLTGVDEKDMVSYRQILKDSYLLVPMILLVVMLLKGYSPFMAANVAIAVVFLISFLKKETRMTPSRLFETLRLAGQNMIMIALACAGAGMVVAIVTHTGLALGIATVITNWSGGHLLPAMLLVMCTSLVMGMGLPCTPAYIIAVTIGGPAMLAMGVDMLPAHLFVYYFAVLAGVTPPVCVPAFCAAAIANSPPLETGFEAFKLAIVGFLIPYVFVFNKALLMQGTALEIITVTLMIFLAIVFFASALSRYFFRPLNRVLQAGLFVLAGFTTFICAKPGLLNSPMVRLLGALVLAGIVFHPLWSKFRDSNKINPEPNA